MLFVVGGAAEKHPADIRVHGRSTGSSVGGDILVG
jgi:hypothetical protein